MAGILELEGGPVDRAALARMGAAVAHRGPDGQGEHVEGPLGLAHRRLGIIDLDGGAQPMTSATGASVIAYNGEIYNYLELRAELQQAGFPLRTRSDTEVILGVYEREGVGGLARLSGMYAFALWDRRRRALLLARDPIGIKPLYLAHDGGRVLFASEIKALLAAGLDPPLDPAAVNSYFLRQYVGGGGTIYRGIVKLSPGTVREYAGAAVREVAQWAPRPDRRRLPVAAAAGELEGLLDGAVRRQLRSDVPVGLFLSGGLDSSCLLAFAARHAREPLHTFAVGFGTPKLDDLSWARLVAGRFGTRHHELTVGAHQALACLPHVIASLDQPLADYAIVPTYLMSRFARERVKVVLGGEGADELFGGYPFRYLPYVLAQLLEDRMPWLGRLPLPRPRAPLFGEKARARLLGDGFVAHAGLDGEARLRDDLQRFRSAGAINGALVADLRGWLADDLLVKLDEMCMLASLEARVPYLDLELVDAVLAISGEVKIGRAGGKRILRALGRRLLPAGVAERRKHGFTVPVGDWLRGPLRGQFAELVLGNRALDQWLDRRVVAKLWARGAGHRLWSIFVFAWWLAARRRPGRAHA